MGFDRFIDFLPDAKHLSAVDKSAFADILGECMVTYITAQYRHVVVCSGLYPVRSQSLHGGYSSGCIESAMQPSFTEKSSRTTSQALIRNDSARDLVLPPAPGTLYVHSLQ